ncbi:hypothetical protein DPX16_5258 [Anabarilius grahami]|uniref:Uncharacterized protein n=1 Tax=Anabarilius grahami TaxID=495550 RepID=A0A3N0Y1P4_ANAGA|nr:hypothetical protein DPX16_5258 [Anabarilius grahami]
MSSLFWWSNPFQACPEQLSQRCQHDAVDPQPSISALLADHERSVLTTIPAWHTLLSLLSRSIMAWHDFVALYSLTTYVTGSCSLLAVLYKPMEQRQPPPQIDVNLPLQSLNGRDRYLINEQSA